MSATELTERQQLDSFLLLKQSLFNLKQKLLDLYVNVDRRSEAVDWPRYQSSFGVCASELGEIRKCLESERFASAQSMCIGPNNLTTEPIPDLERLTEGRLCMFNQEAAPNYLRTKLAPQVEELKTQVDDRSKSLRNSTTFSPEQAITLHENLVGMLLEDAMNLKMEMDQEQEKLTGLKSTANANELIPLVSTMLVGRDHIEIEGGRK